MRQPLFSLEQKRGLDRCFPLKGRDEPQEPLMNSVLSREVSGFWDHAGKAFL